jgi:hypothetical protein
MYSGGDDQRCCLNIDYIDDGITVSRLEPVRFQPKRPNPLSQVGRMDQPQVDSASLDPSLAVRSPNLEIFLCLYQLVGPVLAYKDRATSS